nr:MAG TPA: hypothetical protein [Microviridae sp.]
MLITTDLSVLKITCLMNKKSFEVYCVQVCGRCYRVKLGHLDEFIALHRDKLDSDELAVSGIVWDRSSNFVHPYEWYRNV